MYCKFDHSEMIFGPFEKMTFFGEHPLFTSTTTPHNSLEPRTRGAIALSMMGNDRGGRVLMALDSGKLVRKAHCKEIPMTQEVIDRVNYLGRGEKSLLTFTNKRGEEIGERSVPDRVVEADVDEPIEQDMLALVMIQTWTLSMTSQEWTTHMRSMWMIGTRTFQKMATISSIKLQATMTIQTQECPSIEHLEPINDNSDTGVTDVGHNDGHFENDGHFKPITLLTPSASPSATTQDGGGRPTRVRKQVSS